MPFHSKYRAAIRLIVLLILFASPLPLFGDDAETEHAEHDEQTVSSPTDDNSADRKPANDAKPDPKSTKTAAEKAADRESRDRLLQLIMMLTIFVLAIFVGFEIITKVPPTLHTPLMSGSNAISGITLVGAVIVAASDTQIASFVAMFGVILATINAVGGFLVTHRMLAMFKKR